MKKLLILLLSISTFLKCYSQNIGINATGATPHPSAMLDVSATDKGMLIPRMTSAQRTAISSPATGLLVYDTDNSSFWFYNGTVWAQLVGGSSTSYWSVNGSDIFNNNSGKVGIGTNTPITKLNVKTLTNDYGVTQTDGTVTVGTYIGASEGWLGTRSNHPLTFFTNNGGQAMTLATNGYLGIGNNTPANRLELGKSPFGSWDFAIGATGNSSEGMAFLTNSSFTEWSATRDITIYPGSSSGTPHVGIVTSSPVNTLQVGGMGSTGFNGNQIAFGNGTNATGLYQSNTSLQVASSTNIVLLPGQQRVGINTSTPRAPLDVVDFVAIPNSNYDYLNSGAIQNGIQSCDLCTANVSIRAESAVYAAEFDANSDARIKDIIGLSNSINDLQTLNSLRITNYTLKERMKYGDKPFKKIIAQEVEKVYPQVVSKHTDFIPNVYQLTSKVEKVVNGYQLSFARKHNISDSAKKLRVLLPGMEGIKEINIVSIPSQTEVIINANEINTDKIFVYGEEVNDFRTVDYEGLTTLNISATQQLSKLIVILNKKIETMEREIEWLKRKKN